MCRKLTQLLTIALFLTTIAAFADVPVIPLPVKPESPKSAKKLQKDGNYKEAYEAYEKLCLDAEQTGHEVGESLRQALRCLQSINRIAEADALIEKTITMHPEDWRLLADAADIYQNRLSHHGYIIAGKFSRGYHRGDGRAVNSSQRDRVRALQLYEKSRTIALQQNGWDYPCRTRKSLPELFQNRFA